MPVTFSESGVGPSGDSSSPDRQIGLILPLFKPRSARKKSLAVIKIAERSQMQQMIDESQTEANIVMYKNKILCNRGIQTDVNNINLDKLNETASLISQGIEIVNQITASAISYNMTDSYVEIYNAMKQQLSLLEKGFEQEVKESRIREKYYLKDTCDVMAKNSFVI
jgi:hypothetical protein